MALLFGDERATKAVLSFLRKTRVGQLITIPPRDGGGEEGAESERDERSEAEGEEGGPRPPSEIEKRKGTEEGAAFRAPECLFVFFSFRFVFFLSFLFLFPFQVHRYAGEPRHDGKCTFGTGLRGCG